MTDTPKIRVRRYGRPERLQFWIDHQGFTIEMHDYDEQPDEERKAHVDLLDRSLRHALSKLGPVTDYEEGED